MPRKSKKSKTTRQAKTAAARHEMIDTKTENLMPVSPSHPSDMLLDPSKAASFRWGVFVVLLVLIGAVYLATRGLIVSAIVDGKPIFGWDVASTVMSQYGQQTLQSMISQQLITETAQKQKIVISDADVKNKIDQLVKSLGPNVTLDDLLKYQGVTQSQFNDQVRLQLTVEKILGKDITVSDQEISDYIDKNKSTMTSTDDASLQEEARQAVFSQKLSAKIQPWFDALKQKAKITLFLK